ncbi:serine hydrolase domain-containing protein [Lysobacter capsici]|uniref:serine hydrolase domain-containing protein n=1 Tax=Lysobacter capsici TaxID=435897 RepID=UPI001C002736|nr:serine hydrolase domain-containing protein [Lysobacter capsici]QWF16330.1 beta-lactamase family protein [Lysobacter capsici]
MTPTASLHARAALPFTARRLAWLRSLAAAGLLALLASGPVAARVPSADALDAQAAQAMAATQARGLAIAVVDRGRVVRVRSYGSRNAQGQPLRTDTVMYGASLTKAAFGYFVAQLVDEGRLDLDKPIADYLDRPLPDYPDEDRYAPWSNLAGDDRWRKLTARHLLTHSSGFANFFFLEADGKLQFHFDPGTRYGYSGDGLILLQFVIERGLGIDLGEAMRERVFAPLGMRDTSMIWQPRFAANLADGWRADGAAEPHDERGRVRAAGSMDTSIDDMARFAAGLVRGAGLSKAMRAELARPQLPITTRSQFPTLQPELSAAQRRADLAAGLGVIAFRGPRGAGFMKGGHDDSTANTLVCIERGQRCVVILSNDVRAEAAFPKLVEFVLGETGAPWRWEYGDMKFWDGSR